MLFRSDIAKEAIANEQVSIKDAQVARALTGPLPEGTTIEEQGRIIANAIENATPEQIKEAEVKAEEQPIIPKTETKPITIENIKDPELKDWFDFEKKDIEDTIDIFESGYAEIKKRHEKKNFIGKFLYKMPTEKQYGLTKYKEKLNLIENNPEQYLSKEIEEYENIKKAKGENFEYEDYLNSLKYLHSKLKDELTIIPEPKVEVAEVKVEEPKAELLSTEVQKTDIENTLYPTISGSTTLREALPNGVYMDLRNGFFRFVDKKSKIAALVDKKDRKSTRLNSSH